MSWHVRYRCLVRAIIGVSLRRCHLADTNVCQTFWCAVVWLGRWGMDAIKGAVSEGRRQCGFFAELAQVARSWEGDINGTQAYVLEEHFLVC